MAAPRIALASLGLFLVILVATAPARLLGYGLPAGLVVAEGYRGTLWNGSVSRCAIVVDGGLFELGQLDWALSPGSLLAFSPRLVIDSRWGSQEMVGDFTLYGDGAVRVRDGSFSVGADLLRRWLPVKLEGNLNLQLPGMTFSETRPAAGEGRLVWQGARWTGVRGSQALGDYVLKFHVDENRVLQGKVTTLSGPIRALGSVQLDGRSYEVDLRLDSKAPFDAELRSALALIAAPVDGGYQLQLAAEF